MLHKHMKQTHKHKYVQIILVLLHLHQLVLCIDGVTNSLHFMECINNKYILAPNARCVDPNVCI